MAHDEQQQTNAGQATRGDRRTYSRRRFLMGVAALVSGGTLAACGNDVPSAARSRVPDTYPQRILPSPVAPGTPTPLPAPRPGELSLEQFLALSAVLTGFDVGGLSPAIGVVYLQSLHARSNPSVTLMALFEQAGFTTESPPDSIDALEATGIFDQEPTRSLADTIIEYWYTGIYGSDDSQQIATYVDALAWEAITFTKPRSICGPHPGFWREPPPVLP